MRVGLVAAILICFICTAEAASSQTSVVSPDGLSTIVLTESSAESEPVRYSVNRDGRPILHPSQLGPVLTNGKPLGEGARIVNVRHGEINEQFELRFSKTNEVHDHCLYAVVDLVSPSNIKWSVELRAYNDGVAFRYHLPRQEGLDSFEIRDEVTQFNVAGAPKAMFNTLSNFTTSHESLYSYTPVSAIPEGKLLDMPLLLTWARGHAAAITEARVRNFSGAYLERDSAEATTLRCRLSPLPSRENVSVIGETPHSSPWRVILLSDVAGELLESSLLLCLNDPECCDFSWLEAGKTTWHWWYGEFEDDYKLPPGSNVPFERHKKYIDFCARNNIAYHAVSGDGLAWYKQSKTDYGTPAADADVRVPREEIQLQKIIDYARDRGVGIRLWVHWKPLSKHLEEAFSLYESWGVKGLMVDFLNRDDQEMIEFTDRMLASAARHNLHIQLHGASKYSGEQRTFPNLFNREGVLNLEFLKWSDLCTPAHNVNVAYTRGLAGPVDYHHGGFRSVSRTAFRYRDRAPFVMGTRCHHLALYVVYENPMPMVSDAPHVYEGQTGFEFIAEVPTTWDETRFLAGEPGEYIVIARRKADDWYIGGITNWSGREISVPLGFLDGAKRVGDLYVDGSMDESLPNAIRREKVHFSMEKTFQVKLAPGGGFVAVLRRQPM